MILDEHSDHIQYKALQLMLRYEVINLLRKIEIQTNLAVRWKNNTAKLQESIMLAEVTYNQMSF